MFSAFNELHRGIFSGGGGVPRMTALDHIHGGGTDGDAGGDAGGVAAPTRPTNKNNSFSHHLN